MSSSPFTSPLFVTPGLARQVTLQQRPVWERWLASTYFLGHTQYADCGVCVSNDLNRNHFRGHSQWLFDFQVSLHNTYN